MISGILSECAKQIKFPDQVQHLIRLAWSGNGYQQDDKSRQKLLEIVNVGWSCCGLDHLINPSSCKPEIAGLVLSLSSLLQAIAPISIMTIAVGDIKHKHTGLDDSAYLFA